MKETSHHFVPNRNAAKAHNVKTAEVTAAYLAIGWIGKLRDRPIWPKSILRDEIGPGFGR